MSIELDIKIKMIDGLNAMPNSEMLFNAMFNLFDICQHWDCEYEIEYLEEIKKQVSPFHQKLIDSKIKNLK